MFCVKLIRRNNSLSSSVISKVYYSRRSDKNVISYKVVKAKEESLNDIDNMACEVNSNWELLTPRGFRFYLPGCIGPGWTDENTTVQPNESFTNNIAEKEFADPSYNIPDIDEGNVIHYISQRKHGNGQELLTCVAQECPILLRKGIEELFPGCLDVTSPQLTIVTISQKAIYKSRWSKEVEIETLAKHFVLAASDICAMLKMVGYWADFINPFSGQPYFSTTKNSTLYKTDERFRCLGFKIEHKNNCKVIYYDSNVQTFIGSLYTTAPSSTSFLRDLLENQKMNP